MKLSALAAALCAFAFALPAGRADVPMPANVLDPPTAPEAWNIIRLATANVERLLNEDRLPEIIAQVSLCSPALRRLALEPPPADDFGALKAASTRGIALVNSVAVASTGGDKVGTAKAFAGLRDLLAETAKRFDPKVVSADIFFCPMHPDVVSQIATAPCEKCGMNLVKRRIPYSFIYVPPGEPTMMLSATANGPLEAGRRADVKVRIKRRDGSPVLLRDLMVMHTQPIHLLIVDPGLTDYHHEHPKPTDVPGEYTFSFTPANSGPHRIWADLVPVDSGIQEYPTIELAGAGAADSIGEMSGRFSTTAGGLNFRMTFENGALPHARQVRIMQVEVTEADGKPVRRLEPVMNAFAHLVGFYDDYKTVVHLHPEGGDILRADVRGGPTMTFKFYPPRAGFFRAFCQVVVDGKTIFAPFNVNVAP